MGAESNSVLGASTVSTLPHFHGDLGEAPLLGALFGSMSGNVLLPFFGRLVGHCHDVPSLQKKKKKSEGDIEYDTNPDISPIYLKP
jgi:hypothetical protein